jgi:thiamine biosynthesis lipoprotein
VLKASAAISVKSGGAFDVTIGPFTKLWRRARRQGELPTPASIASCHDAVGYHFVELHEEARAARLLRANMRVDLGGIGKGYAVDEALQAISKVGIQSALVNGGGDLAVSRPPPGKAGWEVVLAGLDPNETSARHTILLSNQAIATSGDAWQYLEIDGQRYSHIVDPRTGIGTTRRMSISIVAPTCMAADGWASALCVLGRDDGLKLLAHEKRHEARIITVEDDVPREIRTAEFPVDR